MKTADTHAHAPLFQSGRIYATQAIMAAIGHAAAIGSGEPFLLECLRRHFSGDGGDLDAEDHEANRSALETGARIFSAYHYRDGEEGEGKGLKVWIITDAEDDDGHRAATTILFPSEY